MILEFVDVDDGKLDGTVSTEDARHRREPVELFRRLELRPRAERRTRALGVPVECVREADRDVVPLLLAAIEEPSDVDDGVARRGLGVRCEGNGPAIYDRLCHGGRLLWVTITGFGNAPTAATSACRGADQCDPDRRCPQIRECSSLSGQLRSTAACRPVPSAAPACG